MIGVCRTGVQGVCLIYLILAKLDSISFKILCVLSVNIRCGKFDRLKFLQLFSVLESGNSLGLYL